MTALPPPALPADARYRPIRHGVITATDRQLADTTRLLIPRGIVQALADNQHHNCTALQRPVAAGFCKACDLNRLAQTHATIVVEETT